MKRLVLDTSRFPGLYTGDHSTEKIRKSQGKFAIADSMICTCIHGKVMNNMAAGKILEEESGWTTLHCAAHLLQTTARHTLASSTSKSVLPLLAASRKPVGHSKHSNCATEELGGGASKPR